MTPALRRYRTKPVEVEAIQYLPETCAEVHRLLEVPHEHGNQMCGTVRVRFYGRYVDPREWLLWVENSDEPRSMAGDSEFRAKYEEV